MTTLAASSKRQLRLPGLDRRTSDGWQRARLDLSAAAFDRALMRNGFRAAGGGLTFLDTSGATGERFEGVYRSNPIRLRRRATLAKIIREREIEREHYERTQP